MEQQVKDGTSAGYRPDDNYIIEKYAEHVFRLAFSYTRDRAEAEDIMQETFLRYVRFGKDFKCEEHVKAWLLRVAANCAKTSLIKRTNEPVDYSGEMDSLHRPGSRRSENEQLSAALDKLTPNQRICIHLFYYEDYSIAEISNVSGFSPTSVKTHLFRARITLKKLLTEQ